MSENSKIQWTSHTFNPWRGCSKVNAGCTNCYAEVNRSVKIHDVKWGTEKQGGTRVRLSDAGWKEPLKWNRQASELEEIGLDLVEKPRPRVFCASLADVFEDWDGAILDHLGNQVLKCWACGAYERDDDDSHICPNHEDPISDRIPRRATMNDLRADLFRLIDATPNLDWMLLTKRPENIRRMLDMVYPVHTRMDLKDHQQYRQNVWLGTSCSDQATADKAIPELLKCRDLARVLFVSAEPLIGPIDLSKYISYDGMYENEISRERYLRSGRAGIAGNRRKRADLESSRVARKQVECTEDSSQSGSPESRERSGEVFSSAVDEGREVDSVSRAKTSMEARSRSNSSADDSEPHRWKEEEQPSEESRTSDSFRTDEACASQEVDKPRWREKPEQQIDERASRGDSGNVCDREGQPEGVGGDVRSVSSADIESGKGRTKIIAGGQDSRLHEAENTRDEGAKRAGAISLVICGGESGPKARPCNVEWIRDIGRQCQAAGVAWFNKQLGSQLRPSPLQADVQLRFVRDTKGGNTDEWPEDLRVREMPK